MLLLLLIYTFVFTVIFIASDISVFREIGGDYPLYFDLLNLDSLVSAIDKVHNFTVQPKKPLY